jgi:hypothetical protein
VDVPEHQHQPQSVAAGEEEITAVDLLFENQAPVRGARKLFAVEAGVALDVWFGTIEEASQ